MLRKLDRAVFKAYVEAVEELPRPRKLCIEVLLLKGKIQICSDVTNLMQSVLILVSNIPAPKLSSLLCSILHSIQTF